MTVSGIRHASPRAACGGFTLVELLVILTILGLLLRLLLPGVQRLRASAASVQCQSNLRQSGVGFTLYMRDHQGRTMVMPPAQLSRWVYELGDYMDGTPNWGEPRSTTIDRRLVTRCPRMLPTWDYWYGTRGTHYDARLSNLPPVQAFAPRNASDFALLRDLGPATDDWADGIHAGRHNVLFFDMRVESRTGPSSARPGPDGYAYDWITREYFR